MKKIFSGLVVLLIISIPVHFLSALTITSQGTTTITAQVGSTTANSTTGSLLSVHPEVVMSPTSISFSGIFFSGAHVVVLQDGQEFLSGVANNSAAFFLLKTGITPGVYTFTVFIELSSGKRILIDTFHVIIPLGAFVKIEHIKISPDIWDLLFPNNVTVNLKNYCTTVIADINCDERVDLIDLSILHYWYRSGKYSRSKDLNDDKQIDLGDFSVLAYYWTG